jgi:hypothetical protein
MIATQSQRLHCMISGAPATVMYYPDSKIVRICAEGGQCFEELRWYFGWDALLEAIGLRSMRREHSSTVPDA